MVLECIVMMFVVYLWVVFNIVVWFKLSCIDFWCDLCFLEGVVYED